MARQTLLDVFDDLARTSGEFLVYDDGFRTHTYTYEQVVGGARAFAGRLASSGVATGDKVVLWSENRPEWIVAFWGCILRGVIVVPIDYRSSSEVLTKIRRIVGAKVVLTGEEVPALEGADADAMVWPLEELSTRRSHATDSLEAGPRRADVSADDVAEIIFTSGATGEPRGVLISHRNILANIVPVERGILKYRKWGKPFFPLRFLNLLPLSHMFGQTMATFIPPMLAGTVIFMRGHDPGDIARLVKRRRVSVIVRGAENSRAAVRRTCRCGAWSAPRRSSRAKRAKAEHWILAMVAVPPRALDLRLQVLELRRRRRAARQRPRSVLVGAWVRGHPGIRAHRNRAGRDRDQPVRHPARLGRKAISGVNVKIAPDGEILVRGDNVTKGYFNAKPETDAAFEDGWFHTGDVGELTPEGRLFIRGRQELIVTPDGMKVFPEDVERVLNAIPGVRESAAIGVAAGGAASNEQVNAVLALEPGIDPDAVVRDANSRLEAHQRIRRALVWPEAELPRTPGTAKLKRAAIRDWARGGAGSPPPKGASDALWDFLAKILRANRSVSVDDDRGAGPQLARSRRAHGGARGVSGNTAGRAGVRRGAQLGELRALVERSGGAEARSGGGDRLSGMEPLVARARAAPGPDADARFCLSRACSPGRGWRGGRGCRRSQDRWSSPPITRASWTRR